ncbi:MAG: matrixin family metalloprotease [Bdellovibrionales bacterium]
MIIREAAKKWNEAIGREVIRIEIEGVAGDINDRRDNISMIYLLSQWDNDNIREQARTSVRWRGTEIIESDILLNDEYFNFSVDVKTPQFYVDLESLLIHEMGHALGLAHVEETGSVMYPQLARGQERRLVAEIDLESLSCEY